MGHGVRTGINASVQEAVSIYTSQRYLYTGTYVRVFVSTGGSRTTAVVPVLGIGAQIVLCI